MSGRVVLVKIGSEMGCETGWAVGYMKEWVSTKMRRNKQCSLLAASCGFGVIIIIIITKCLKWAVY